MQTDDSIQTVRITLVVAAEEGDAAAERLMEEGVGFDLVDATTLDKPAPGTVELRVYEDATADGARALGERLAGALAEAGIEARLGVSSVDAGWRDAWKAWFRPRPVGPFVIVPSWESYAPAPGETVIGLDPGRAFGTGGHASTRLCLKAIGRLTRCERFLDVGTGSGVLAIACALRWPRATGVAIDVDPEALEVALENAIDNGVAERVAIPPLAIEAVEGRFDLVLANITAETIALLAEAMAARVAPGGRLVASGILAPEAEGVAARLSSLGLVLEASDAEDEWRGLTLVRRA